MSVIPIIEVFAMTRMLVAMSSDPGCEPVREVDMIEAEKVIQDYLKAIETVKGVEARKKMEVHWTGGSRVVIHDAANDEHHLVGVGTLRLMTEHLSKAA